MDLVDDKDEFGPDKVDELNSAFGKKQTIRSPSISYSRPYDHIAH